MYHLFLRNIFILKTSLKFALDYTARYLEENTKHCYTPSSWSEKTKTCHANTQWYSAWRQFATDLSHTYVFSFQRLFHIFMNQNTLQRQYFFYLEAIARRTPLIGEIAKARTHKLSGFANISNIWGKSSRLIFTCQAPPALYNQDSAESQKNINHRIYFVYIIYFLYHLEIKFENFEVPSSMLWFPSPTKLSHISHLGGATGVATSVVQVHVYLYFCISISLTLYILYLYFDL